MTKKDNNVQVINPIDNLEFKKITWINNNNNFIYKCDPNFDQTFNFSMNLKFPVSDQGTEIDYSDPSSLFNSYPIFSIPAFSIRSRRSEKNEQGENVFFYSEWVIFNNLIYTPFRGIKLDREYYPDPEKTPNNQFYSFLKVNFWDDRKKVNDWISVRSQVELNKVDNYLELNFWLYKYSLKNDENLSYDLEVLMSDEISLSPRNSFGVKNV